MFISFSLSLFKATSHPAVSSASKIPSSVCVLLRLGFLHAPPPQPRQSLRAVEAKI